MSLWGVGPVFTILSLLMIAGCAVLAWSYPAIFSINRGLLIFYFIGALLIGMGFFLWIPAGSRIDGCIRRGFIADQGVYGIVRHPIYSGILFVLSGFCIAAHSLILLIPPVVIYLILRVLLRREEKVMHEAFGEAYQTYRRRIPAVIPHPAGLFQAFFYPSETGKITEGIFAIRDKDVNVFLVTDGSHTICIDSGYKAEHLAENIRELGYDPQSISAVLLTHTDKDHREGLKCFPNAKLFIGKDEDAMISGRKYRLPFYRNKPLGRGFTILQDKEQLTFGSIRVTAIATPGHTFGHTAYLINDRFLFTGDAAVFQNGSLRPFYRLFNMNHRRAKASFEKIKNLDGIEMIFTSHTGAVSRVEMEQGAIYSTSRSAVV